MYCPNCETNKYVNTLKCENCGEVLPQAVQSSPLPFKNLSTYFIPAILVTFFLFPPVGMTALLCSIKAKRKLKERDYEGAIDLSKKAKKWCWNAFAVGLGFHLILVGIIIYDHFTQIDKSYVALVGEERISIEELKNAMAHQFKYLKILSRQESEFFNVRRFDTPGAVLKNLIDIKLLINSAKNKKIIVSDEEIRINILSYPIFKKNGRFSPEYYSRFISQFNIKPADFEKDLKNQMIIQKLTRHIAHGIHEKEKNKYLEEHIAGLRKNVEIITNQL
jgi:hypothetical protein